MKKQVVYSLATTLIAMVFLFWMYFHIAGSPIAPLFVAPIASGLTASFSSSLIRKQNKTPILSGVFVGFMVSWMMFSFGTLSGLLATHISSYSTAISLSELVAPLKMSFIYTPMVFSMSVGFLPTVLIIFATLILTTSNARGGNSFLPPSCQS